MSKSNKSKDSNNNKKMDNTSTFSNKRSNKFDDLTSTTNTNRPNNSGFSSLPTKERMKKIWKWIVIAIYLFLAGLGVTGFIQSCVLHTNSRVGAGVELYLHDKVAPYVTVYQIEEKWKEQVVYDENGNPVVDENGNIKFEKIKYYELVAKSKENFLATDETISQIEDNLNAQYGEHGEKIKNLYGDYNNYSSSIRIIGLDGLPIDFSKLDNLNGSVEASELVVGYKESTTLNDAATSTPSNYIFMNNLILKYLNENGISYAAQNDWYEISYFVASRPDDWDSQPNLVKDYYGQGITDLSNSFQAFENIGTEDKPNWVKIDVINGEYVTKDVNGDGIIDSSSYVKITDKNRISKFKYSLNAEVATLSNSEEGLLNSEKYARDYVQSFFNVAIKFPQLNSFYELINDKTSSSISTSSSVSDIYSTLSKSNLESLTSKRVITRNTGIDSRAIDTNKLFTLEQKNAILTYQNEISSLMTQLGFGIRKQVYSDESSDDYVSDGTTPFVVEFQPNVKNKKDIVLGTSSTIQKPIISWSDSWRLGPFYGLVVYPLSSVINAMMGSMPKMAGWDGVIAIVVAILLTRVIATLFTYKSLFASHKQQQLNPKKAKIDAKYEPFKGNREMEQRKRQEISKLYKANNVSMTAPLKAMCISMPIFFAVWRVVQGIPDIKATTWLGIQFSLTSWKELFAGAWQYLPLILFAAGTQLLSQLLPRILNKKRMDERANRAEKAALRKSNKTQNIVMIVFVVMAVIFEAGVQIYWIVSGLWQIFQTLMVHHIVKSEWYRTKGYKYV